MFCEKTCFDVKVHFYEKITILAKTVFCGFGEKNAFCGFGGKMCFCGFVIFHFSGVTK